MRMRKWAAYLLCFLSLALLGISGHFLADYAKQEEKADILQEQLKEIYENQKEETKEKPRQDEEEQNLIHEGLLALHEEYSANGSLFLSENCSLKDCDNLIIYGHHMNSGKMFAALEGYRERKFFKEHPFIFFNTLQGEEKYQVFAVFSTPVYTGSDFAYYTFTKAENRKSYETFIEAVKERSFYDTGITADYGEKLLTLSTCEYSQENGRLVVVAKKIAEKEITK